MDPARTSPTESPWAATTESTGCAGEKSGRFSLRSYPQVNPQPPSGSCGKQLPRHVWLSFLHAPNVRRHLVSASFHNVAGEPGDRLRPPARLGYPSRVCSIMGDAIDRIAEAIDQLARDAHGDFSEQELAARVADLWLMLSALDPELARRKQGYGTGGTKPPADGAPRA